ncbi:MAG: penicillin acylase family protein [Kofleriaceae bacterium]
MTNFSCRVVSLLLLAACGDDQTKPPDTAEYAAQIQRTAFGIPHITAENEKGLGYGVGYAFAQDNLCVLAEEVVTVNGERAFHFGADATYEPSGDGRVLTNLPSDVYFKVLNEASLVTAAWNDQPLEIQDLFLGYAHGYNRHLREVGSGGLAEACRGQPWVREISELDLMRVMRRYAVEGSGAQVIEGLFLAQPPTPMMVAVQPVRGAALADAPIWRRFRPTKGSNGVALGRDATASGAGLLLVNPHFPWRGTFRFYQLHLTIPGVVDVSGATLAGLPGVGLGHNADIAWTHTVNSSRHFAFHQLQLDPTDPTRYMVDGQSIPMTSRDVMVQVRGAGGVETVMHTVWSSEHGPVVVLPGFLDWTPDTAFAFGDANFDNTRLMQSWWGLDKARSLADVRAAVETTLGIPWVHTIAVDAAGTTYYGDVTPVPNIPDRLAATCVPEPFRPLAAAGLMVLDGSTASCRWEVAPGTPQPGIMPASDLPTLVRTDFVLNSNDSAWLANPRAPLTGYPAIASIAGQPLNARTRLGIQQLEAELGGRQRITSARLQDLAFSNLAFHATTLLDDLRGLCATPAAQMPVRSCTVLNGWDGAANLTSVGWPLFRAWRRSLDDAAGAGALDYWTVPFDPADPVSTPRGLRIADPVVVTAARTALLEATAALDAAGIDFTRPWGELQVATRGDRQLPIHGGGGDDFNDGGDEIYNTINSRPTADRHLEPFYGASFIMNVSFEGGRPVAQGLLTYSQSSDPASPHFSDQTERFGNKDWITFPFTQSEIAADPALSVTLLQE